MSAAAASPGDGRPGPRVRMLGVAAVALGVWTVVVTGMVATLTAWAGTGDTFVSPGRTVAIVASAALSLLAAVYAVYAGVRLIQRRPYGGRWTIALLLALLMQVVVGLLGSV